MKYVRALVKLAVGSMVLYGWLTGAAQQLTIEVKDYATMPLTDLAAAKGMNSVYLARVNFLREEPGGNRRRLFVNDLNGPLYILDKKTKTFTTYLNFSELFHKLTTARGYANGFVNFLFDPDYAHNGKFYTIHIEDPALPGSDLPDNAHFPGLRTQGYTVTAGIPTPGPLRREAVVVEWTDLPGQAVISGGRADIRFSMDQEGELYILSKSDGMIRAVVGATSSKETADLSTTLRSGRDLQFLSPVLTHFLEVVSSSPPERESRSGAGPDRGRRATPDYHSR